MNVPAQLKYSEQHEWVKAKGEQAVIGITEFAQSELGDIVFVELPKAGAGLTAGQPFGSVESVKTVSELYAPISGKVIRVNEALESKPDTINGSPYDEGWLIVVEIAKPDELDKMQSVQNDRNKKCDADNDH